MPDMYVFIYLPEPWLGATIPKRCRGCVQPLARPKHTHLPDTPKGTLSQQQLSYSLHLGDKDGHSLAARGLTLQGADIEEGRHTL